MIISVNPVFGFAVEGRRQQNCVLALGNSKPDVCFFFWGGDTACVGDGVDVVFRRF